MTADQVTYLEIAGLVLVLILAIFLMVRGGATQRRVRRRLQRLSERRPEAKDSAQTQLRRREVYSAHPGLDQLLKRFLPNPAALHNRLARTGMNITVARYLAINAAVLMIAAGLLLMVGVKPVGAALLAVSAGIGIPHLAVGRLIQRRIRRFNDQFPDAIDLMVRGIRAGLPIIETIGVVAIEMPEPVRGEFRRVTDNLLIGQPFDEALWAAARRIDSPEFRFFVVSLSIQRETGGNLAETLENLSDILRRRRQLRLKVKAVSSEARAGAWVIGSLPFGLGSALAALNPHYMGPLFHTGTGHIILGVGLAGFATGVAVLAKLVNFQI